jgi:hypothetical protein
MCIPRELTLSIVFEQYLSTMYWTWTFRVASNVFIKYWRIIIDVVERREIESIIF